MADEMTETSETPRRLGRAGILAAYDEPAGPVNPYKDDDELAVGILTGFAGMADVHFRELPVHYVLSSGLQTDPETGQKYDWTLEGDALRQTIISKCGNTEKLWLKFAGGDQAVGSYFRLDVGGEISPWLGLTYVVYLTDKTPELRQ